MNRILALTAPVVICATLMLPAAAQDPSYNDRAKSILASGLDAKNPDIRKATVKAMTVVASQEPFASRLETMLIQDSDIQVRTAVIEALEEVKTARAIAALKTALKDKVPEVRFAAAKALFKLKDSDGRAFMIAVLNGDAKAASGMVASHLQEAKRTTQTPNVLLLLAIKEGVSIAPVPGLGEGFSVIREVTAHLGVSERAATALLLGKTSDPEAIDALRNALNDKKPAVRAAAAHALAMAADEKVKQEASSLFVPLFSDKNRTVRIQAAASFLRLDEQTATRASETGE